MERKLFVPDNDPGLSLTNSRNTIFRIGPAIVVAAVVLGPGSIVTASRVGCEYGLSLLWVVPLAGILMIGMTMAAMLIGVSKQETLCTSVANAFGRPAAWIVGISSMGVITLSSVQQ